jgi:hypothetical protein
VPLDRVDLSARLDSALSYLDRQQRPNGEFPTFKAADDAVVHERSFDSTPFATTYVLHGLSHVEWSKARALAEPALDFLEAEMEPHGVWRYWTSQHPQHQFVPPDLDDTCCAAAALRRFGRSVPENVELILANRNRAGLFYTWLVPRLPRKRTRPFRRQTRAFRRAALRGSLRPTRLRFWRTAAGPWDVDCVVNANVLHWLGDRVEARPVADFLRRALEDGRASSCDKWHRNECAFYYSVSRAYGSGVGALEPIAEELRAHIESRLTRAEELAPAEVALAVCSLLNLNHPVADLEPWIALIAGTQRPDGGWPSYVLYWGGPVYGWGSEALTTGLCVEVLARVMKGPEPERAAR